MELVNNVFKVEIDERGPTATLPEELLGDQIRLKQVLINLVKNALKFTAGGSITIHTSYDNLNELLKFSIVDTGLGIKEEEQKNLFSLFGQVERTADVNPDGLGIGLIMCKKLVENTGGSISFFSAGENLGATFKFTMHMKPVKTNEEELDRMPSAIG